MSKLDVRRAPGRKARRFRSLFRSRRRRGGAPIPDDVGPDRIEPPGVHYLGGPLDRIVGAGEVTAYHEDGCLLFEGGECWCASEWDADFPALECDFVPIRIAR